MTEIRRIFKGERYTAVTAEGYGFMSAIAPEDGYEILTTTATIWVTDAELNRAHQEAEAEVLEEQKQALDEAEIPLPTISAPVCEDCGYLIPCPTHGGPAPEETKLEPTERCPRCQRPGTEAACPFDCATCHGCGAPIPDGSVRLFTTSPWVYCFDCAQHQ